MTLILNRADAIRPAVERAIDDHFAELIAVEIGPLGALHALKRAQASAGAGPLVDGDRDAILARAAEQDERLAQLDRQRRAMKARARAATSSAELAAISTDINAAREA